MKIQTVQNEDIDGLKDLQPEGWEDIRPYFYYYTSSSFCEPIKITEGNKIVAIGTTLKHADTAWLAHVVVHPDCRNQGLGKKLTSALVESLDPQVYETVYLDATDMGYPVYKSLGFEIETEYIHLDGECIDQHLKKPGSVIPFEEKYRTELLTLDRITTGENRETILSGHLKSSLLYLSDGKVRGAYFPDLFDRFILADDPDTGTELMKLRMRVKNTARFPINNQSAIDFLLANNYKQVRTSRKMRLGKKTGWIPENIFNRISGGLG